MLGLAVGDAVGTTVEFEPPGTFPAVTDMVGGGPFQLEAGQWTDDTSMALCLAESLVERGWDPSDQMARYVRWWRDGHMSSTGSCFDIGGATQRALSRFERTGSAFADEIDPQDAANGSIMRLAPVPLYFSHDLQVAIERSGESSRTTHPARRPVDACRYLGALIASAGTASRKTNCSRRSSGGSARSTRRSRRSRAAHSRAANRRRSPARGSSCARSRQPSGRCTRRPASRKAASER
jgi:ADP-ribosylglycohydrolase